MNRIICPKCGKELIQLHREVVINENGAGVERAFWCDNCNLDIVITEYEKGDD